MHRIDDDYLETMIAVAIKTAPKTVRQGLRSKLPVIRDKAATELAQHIVNDISSGSRMVISTELVNNIGNSGRAGIWGVDEPCPVQTMGVKSMDR